MKEFNWSAFFISSSFTEFRAEAAATAAASHSYLEESAEQDGAGVVARGGQEGTDGAGRDVMKGGTLRTVSFRPRSSSPPTSMESLGDKDGYSSSGVDSSPTPFSDIACTPGALH